MYQIVLSGGKNRNGSSFQEFESEFLDICRDHQAKGRALALAMILYDFAHPQMRKMLHDRRYWDALDTLSGRFLTVFSFNFRAGSARSPVVNADLQKLAGFVQAKFGETLSGSHPVVLFFQVHGDELSDACLVSIRAKYVEKTFTEISGLLQSVVESIQNVRPENRENTKEIFDLIQSALKERKEKIVIKTAAAVSLSLLGLLATLRGAAGF